MGQIDTQREAKQGGEKVRTSSLSGRGGFVAGAPPGVSAALCGTMPAAVIWLLAAAAESCAAVEESSPCSAPPPGPAGCSPANCPAEMYGLKGVGFCIGMYCGCCWKHTRYRVTHVIKRERETDRER